MRLILDKTKLHEKNPISNWRLIVNIPFDPLRVTVDYSNNEKLYYLNVEGYHKLMESYNHSYTNSEIYHLYWNSNKQMVLDEYNKLLQAYYNGDKSYTFTWN